MLRLSIYTSLFLAELLTGGLGPQPLPPMLIFKPLQPQSTQTPRVNPNLSVFTGVVSTQLQLPSQMQTEELPKGLVWF